MMVNMLDVLGEGYVLVEYGPNGAGVLWTRDDVWSDREQTNLEIALQAAAEDMAERGWTDAHTTADWYEAEHDGHTYVGYDIARAGVLALT